MIPEALALEEILLNMKYTGEATSYYVTPFGEDSEYINVLKIEDVPDGIYPKVTALNGLPIKRSDYIH